MGRVDGGNDGDVSERADGAGDREGTRNAVHGIDFSGARTAGEKVWIASATIGGTDNGFRIERCRSVADVTGTTDRASTLDYLRDFLASERRAVVGLDFSFGVPRGVTETDSWGEFVRDFSFENSEEMVDTYVTRTRERTDGERTYLKRATDTETGASSPYGFVVSAQTLYGIRDVLRPLVREERVSVLPMGAPDETLPWLCESYPAATLRDLDLPSRKYKNDEKHPEARHRRERIVTGLREAGVTFEGAIPERAIADSGGDALDSIVAAFATFRALRDGRLTAPDDSNDELGDDSRDERRTLEGHIYV